MELREIDHEIQKISGSIEQLSRKILCADSEQKSKLVKKQFKMTKEYQNYLNTVSKIEALTIDLPNLNIYHKNMIYWTKFLSRQVSALLQDSMKHSSYNMWLNLYRHVITGDFTRKHEKESFKKLKLSLDEEYFELQKIVKDKDKELKILKDKKDLLELYRSNHEAMSNLYYDIDKHKLNSTLSKTLKEIISPLYPDNEFIKDKQQTIKCHKSLSQNLSYYCKRYMDLPPQSNFASRNDLLIQLQKVADEINNCEKDLESYDLSNWELPESSHIRPTKSSLNP